MKKLESGVDPQTLGLGKDCVQPDVGRLLVQLARVWVEAPAPRQFTRRLVAARSELVSGLESIHSRSAARRSRAAAPVGTGTTPAATPSRSTSTRAPVGRDEEASTAFTAEKWETLDESANGFRIRRKGPGERLSLGQLIGVRPDGARGFILSEVRWLMSGIDGSMTVGASALPGLAKAVAVRPASTPNNAPEPYHAGVPAAELRRPAGLARDAVGLVPVGRASWRSATRTSAAGQARRARSARLRLRPRQLLGGLLDRDRLRREPLHPPRREHRREAAALSELARHLEPRLVAREHVLHDR